MKITPIDRILVNPINRFISNSIASGIVLFVATILAMILANSSYGTAFHHFWEQDFTIKINNFEISRTLHHWINEGLMSIFFFVIGLELKREIIGGELSNPKDAILPFAAGIGGMIVPVIIYGFFNRNGDASHGWGIPMATDIAFVLAILHLLGKKVPLNLKIFLTALSIVDDLGAVLVVALFYTNEITMNFLLSGFGFVGLLILGNLLGVRTPIFYILVGIFGVWTGFMMSGIHATVAGLVTAFTVPANVKLSDVKFVEKLKTLTKKFEKAATTDASIVTNEQLHLISEIEYYSKSAITPLQKLEHSLHPIVSFIIMPVFALANAGIHFPPDFLATFLSPVSLGVFFGSVLGKTIGIILFCKVLVGLKWVKLPNELTWRHIYGASILGGVGFSMSLFITDLAFDQATYLLQAKMGIIFASLICGVVGYLILKGAKTKKEIVVPNAPLKCEEINIKRIQENENKNIMS